jgi:hypothetical protein
MNGFRRFILSVIGALEMVFVVGVTLAFGLLGAIPLGMVAGSRWALVGFILSGSVGFCMSALLVNVSMCLAEIAANTYYLKNRS